MNFSLKAFYELSLKELYAILKLRSEVFVVEQNCVYLDSDGIDEQALHLFTKSNEQLIAYCRIIPPGIIYKNPVIGRVVVHSAHRNKKIATQLMQHAISETTKRYVNQGITLSAQMYLLKFYTNLGFSAVGDSYLEDGIPHVKMNYHQ